MFRKVAFSVLALVAVGCGGSGGNPSNVVSLNFLILNEDGKFYRSNPFGGQLQQLNSVNGVYGAVSPNGSLLAYTTYEEGGTRLRIVGTDGSNDRELIDLGGDSSLSFFPGGQEVAFIGGDDATLWLKAANVTTGAVRNVTQLPREAFSGAGLAIDPSGTQAAITTPVGDDTITHVVLVSLTGGGTTDLGRGAHPKFSQDGQRLAFVDGERNLTVLERSTGQRVVSDLSDPVQEVAFTRGGSSVYVSVLVYDDPSTQRNKVGHLLIGSQTPEYLPRQETTTYTIVASVEG